MNQHSCLLLGTLQQDRITDLASLAGLKRGCSLAQPFTVPQHTMSISPSGIFYTCWRRSEQCSLFSWWSSQTIRCSPHVWHFYHRSHAELRFIIFLALKEQKCFLTLPYCSKYTPGTSKHWSQEKNQQPFSPWKAAPNVGINEWWIQQLAPVEVQEKKVNG